jgi:hypothetical protein
MDELTHTFNDRELRANAGRFAARVPVIMCVKRRWKAIAVALRLFLFSFLCLSHWAQVSSLYMGPSEWETKRKKKERQPGQRYAYTRTIMNGSLCAGVWPVAGVTLSSFIFLRPGILSLNCCVMPGLEINEWRKVRKRPDQSWAQLISFFLCLGLRLTASQRPLLFSLIISWDQTISTFILLYLCERSGPGNVKRKDKEI